MLGQCALGQHDAWSMSHAHMNMQDNSNGTKAQSRTFTDLLQTPYDEDLLEYYATSQLVQVHVSLIVRLFGMYCTPPRPRSLVAQ